MSFKSAFAALFSSDDIAKAESVTKSWISSSRAIFVIAFIAFLYFAKALLSTELEIIAASLVALYMICNTVTRVVEIKAEHDLIKDRQRLAWADGILTPDEAATLTGANAALTATATVTATATAPAPTAASKP